MLYHESEPQILFDPRMLEPPRWFAPDVQTNIFSCFSRPMVDVGVAP